MYDENNYSEESFLKATVQALTACGVGTIRANQIAHILNKQNLGELPCPLQEPELSTVRAAYKEAFGVAEQVALQWLVNR